MASNAPRRPTTRRPTNVSLDPNLVTEAREMGMVEELQGAKRTNRRCVFEVAELPAAERTQAATLARTAVCLPQ